MFCQKIRHNKVFQHFAIYDQSPGWVNSHSNILFFNKLHMLNQIKLSWIRVFVRLIFAFFKVKVSKTKNTRERKKTMYWITSTLFIVSRLLLLIESLCWSLEMRLHPINQLLSPRCLESPLFDHQYFRICKHLFRLLPNKNLKATAWPNDASEVQAISLWTLAPWRTLMF